ncbi:ARM repeat superfamily protein [Prunus dulcis]|uniref:ARM repeat superfamily protein n=1 Tax=Prunus dulcis TaxID=3755 RepID=A0A4Y1QKI8_PRUDU|nr:ARM repeat superfamily protein [Prunus dulcis]
MLELSTKRLISDQKNFAEISSHFFDYSWHLWQSDVQTILHGFSTLSESYNSNTFDQHQDELYLTCERWLLCLKIIRQLVVSGFPSDAKCVQEVRPVKEVSPVLLNAIQYFVLSTNDLEEWYQSPESFHHEQDMVQWTEKLRPCAEALYIVLFENHSQLLGPVVVSILKEAMNGCPTSVTEITPGLLLKDAAYGAAAYVYYELSNYLSFKDWFNGALSLELSNDHPNMRIIHRKVALILGQWVSEIKEDTKRPVYCALIRLLQDKDLSVRLAACRSLCLHIEDASFSEREFIDLLPICWESCFKLIEKVQEFDSKVQVLNLISILIGHMSEVMPFANKLILFFQKVWEESSGECLLQIQLLVALRNFVVALGYQSPICYDILLPILQKGIDIDSPDELNLLEDSMLIAVSITEDYIILGGSEFLSIHASSVAQILDLVVGNVNDRGLLSTLPVIDILIQCFPLEVPQLISSTLQKLIVICLGGGDDQDPSKTAVKASSAAILARILVMNTNYLAHLTSEPSLLLLLQSSGIPTEENVLLCLVDIWLDKVSTVQHASLYKDTSEDC